MKTIWQFALKDVTLQTLKLPPGSQFLTVGAQGGAVVAWILVDTLCKEENKVEYRVWQFYTGDSIGREIENARYLATVQLEGIVFHFFVSDPEMTP